MYIFTDDYFEISANNLFGHRHDGPAYVMVVRPRGTDTFINTGRSYHKKKIWGNYISRYWSSGPCEIRQTADGYRINEFYSNGLLEWTTARNLDPLDLSEEDICAYSLEIGDSEDSIW